MRATLTHAIEDYLKAIYDLAQADGRATTNQIAKRMAVAPASVTGMIKKLAALDPPLVAYQKHHGVRLTSAGEQIALEVIRHHRLIELFLQQNLGFTWDEVHDEADRLEHVISETFEERIARAMGDPRWDPHGEPIPSRDLRLPEPFATRLSDLRPGQRAVIRQVLNPEPDLLRHLSSLCMIPGARLVVLDYSPYDDNLTLQLEACSEPVTLGPRLTRQVLVEVLTQP